jgi:hypothetical protein
MSPSTEHILAWGFISDMARRVLARVVSLMSVMAKREHPEVANAFATAAPMPAQTHPLVLQTRQTREILLSTKMLDLTCTTCASDQCHPWKPGQ